MEGGHSMGAYGLLAAILAVFAALAGYMFTVTGNWLSLGGAVCLAAAAIGVIIKGRKESARD